MEDPGNKNRRSSVEKLPNALAPPLVSRRSHSTERSPVISLPDPEELRRQRSVSNSPLPAPRPLPSQSPRPWASHSSSTAPKRRERRRSLGLSSYGGLLQFQDQLRHNDQRRKSIGEEEGGLLTVAYSPAQTLHTKVFVPHQKADGSYRPVTDTALRAKKYLNLLSEEKGSANVRVLGMHTELLCVHPTGDVNERANESLIELQQGMRLIKCIRIWFEVYGSRERRASVSATRRSFSGSEREEEEFGTIADPDEKMFWQSMKNQRDPRSRAQTQAHNTRYTTEEEFTTPPTRPSSFSESSAYPPQRYTSPRRRATLTEAPDEKTADLLNSTGSLELAFPNLRREMSDRTKMIGGQIMRDDYLQLHAEKQKLKDLLRRQHITMEEYRKRDREVAQNFQRTYAGTLGTVRGQLEKLRLILKEKEQEGGVLPDPDSKSP